MQTCDMILLYRVNNEGGSSMSMPMRLVNKETYCPRPFAVHKPMNKGQSLSSGSHSAVAVHSVPTYQHSCQRDDDALKAQTEMDQARGGVQMPASERQEKRH